MKHVCILSWIVALLMLALLDGFHSQTMMITQVSASRGKHAARSKSHSKKEEEDDGEEEEDIVLDGEMSMKEVRQVKGKVTKIEEPWSTKIMLPQYSLGPPPFPEIENMDFTLHDNAKILKGSVRLTENVQSQKGGIWSKKPVTVVKEWQADLRFKVGGSDNKEFHGDGFAFWYVRDRGESGDALGGPSKFVGLGVFFDTYKNENFKTKKHPYVYGAVGDGTKEYMLLTKDAPGCHIPFRNPDPTELDGTIARITYKQSILSVVMQPRGAVDWVQCFELKNVNLPSGYYFGITAMTGGLVDKHHFQQLSVYGNIDAQPFSYAHENDPKQMPAMWEAMRESGKEARMFEFWESDQFVDELKWKVSNKLKEDEDYFDDGYDDDLYGDDDDDTEVDPYSDAYAAYSGDEEVENGEDDNDDAEGNSDGQISHDEFEERLKKDDEKIKSILDTIGKGEISRRLAQRHHENSREMRKIHRHLQRNMQMVTNQLHEYARQMRVKEHELMERIITLSNKLNIDVVDPFELEHESEASGWFWPFIFMMGIIGGMAFFGYNRYKKFTKHHLI